MTTNGRELLRARSSLYGPLIGRRRRHRLPLHPLRELPAIVRPAALATSCDVPTAWSSRGTHGTRNPALARIKKNQPSLYPWVHGWQRLIATFGHHSCLEVAIWLQIPREARLRWAWMPASSGAGRALLSEPSCRIASVVRQLDDKEPSLSFYVEAGLYLAAVFAVYLAAHYFLGKRLLARGSCWYMTTPFASLVITSSSSVAACGSSAAW